MVPKMTLLSLMLLMLWNKATAQSVCTAALVGLSPCLTYITGNSSAPSPSCCSRLSSVVQSQPQCLCALLKGGASNFGILVNQTLALALPGACSVQTPPVRQCHAVNGPPATSTPGRPVADSPGETPDNPSDASKTLPEFNRSFLGGCNKGATPSFLGVLLLVVSSSTLCGTVFLSLFDPIFSS